MQPNIHPKYEVTNVSCSCGNNFQIRSTGKELRAELCNECHPFFTGRQKLVDTGGRVDRFKRRYGARQGGKA
jgi:large subunit ribosomal protein L31